MDVCTLVLNKFWYCVFLSVCSLPHYLTENISTVDISSSGWPIFHIFCKFVSLFITSLHYWNYFNSGYIQFWMTYLSHIFLRHSLYVGTIVSMNFCTLAWNYYIVYVYLSGCLLPHLTQMGQAWLLVNFFWFLGSTLRPLVLFNITRDCCDGPVRQFSENYNYFRKVELDTKQN